MKSEIDFSKAVRGKFKDSIPPGAIFVQFPPAISDLFSGEGTLEDRLRRASSTKRRSKHIVRVIAFSRDEYAALHALISQLGGTPINPAAAKARSLKAS
ncbi:MAG: hypothetical protein WC718_06385 [Phycisphaerales bacterium]|jgi:hypothetical protein